MNDYNPAKNLIAESDAILLTASNGLSIAEGYHIFADNDDFKKYFGDFREKYGIPNLISGVFAELPPSEHERYMTQVHKYLIDDYHGSDVMKNLLEIVKSKPSLRTEISPSLRTEISPSLRTEISPSLRTEGEAISSKNAEDCFVANAPRNDEVVADAPRNDNNSRHAELVSASTKRFRNKFGMTDGESTESVNKQTLKRVQGDSDYPQVWNDGDDCPQSKNYFILTTNADTHFQMNGFDANSIFEAEGNFDTMEMQSAEWNAQYERFKKFVSENADKNLLVMELGVGPRNQYLKSPVMNLLLQNPKWNYLAMNMEKDIVIPRGLEERSLALAGDIAENLKKLRENI